MAELFLQLNKKDRQDALGVAAEKTKRPMHLLEKDVWVVWALRTMFESSFGPHLVFKGGTSLSKAYDAIRRFSEDIDLTYDIRAIAPDLVGKNNDEALPPTKSQEKRWTKEIRERLGIWVAEAVVPLIQRGLEKEGLSAQVSVDPEDAHTARIEYAPAAEGSGYVKPVVILEFGARSTGEPCAPMAVQCDAADALPMLSFPESKPGVMKVEEDLLGKGDGHSRLFCMGGKLRGSRYSRHWYDLAQLDQSGHANAALTRKDIAKQVARHKRMFFSEKAEDGAPIDYGLAVSGQLHLVPRGKRLKDLESDYREMVEDGLLLDEARPFRALMDTCRCLQDEANKPQE